MIRTIPILSIFLLCLLSYPLQAQLFVDGSYTAEEMVEDFFHHPDQCVSVSNVTYTGAEAGMGFFDAGNSTLAVSAGIMLCSGDIETAIGPNNAGGTGDNFEGAGDEDLESLIEAGMSTHDAAVLEFDIVSNNPSIEFQYVFGSEEYLEFVNSGFNDVFAFFVSGPGIEGVKNIALIPGMDIPVSIDNVNAGINSEYFMLNEDPDSGLQYDGLTTALTATMEVTPGESYHIKLAVSDVGDGILDSGVFISVESLCGVDQLSPISDFQSDNIVPLEDPVVTFENNAKYGSSWLWDFGDGTISTERNPTHTYPSVEAAYEVTLSSSNYCCTHTVTQTVVVGNPTEIICSMCTNYFAVYPNPAHGMIQTDLPMDEDFTISLYDNAGHLLNQQLASGHVRLDLAQYGTGLFLLEVVGKDAHISERIINQ